MKKLAPLFLLLLFASTSLLFSACNKDKADPTPTTGTLKGQITPANAIATVTVSDAAGKTTTATPTASGAYTFSDLAAGIYDLDFVPATGFVAPASQTVIISEGGTTTATPVTVVTVVSTSNGLLYTIDGTVRAPNLVNAQLFSGSLLITGRTSTNGISLSIGAFANTTGTFALGPNSTSAIVYDELTSSSLFEWSTSAAGGSGTITITAVGTNPRRVSGTFSAVASPQNSATGTKTITNGTFTDLTY